MDELGIEDLDEGLSRPASRYQAWRLDFALYLRRRRARFANSLDKRGIRRPDRWREAHVGAAILSRDPLVLLVSPSDLLVGVTQLSERLAPPITFYALLSWSAEAADKVQWFMPAIKRFRERFPKNRLVFMCNSPREAQYFLDQGQEAIFAHQSMFVDEDSYFPLAGKELLHDALYNAKLARFKRHSLARAIESVGYIASVVTIDMPTEASRAYLRRMTEHSPKHVILNDLVDGLPVYMTTPKVNEAMAQAAVGLCLSPIEGAMWASIEKQLAGMPIVSTKNIGGRDEFYHPEFTRTVDGDATAVRKAASELAALNLSRDEIRGDTIRTLQQHRERFLDYIDGVFRAIGSSARLGKWSDHGIERKYLSEHLASIKAAQSGKS